MRQFRGRILFIHFVTIFSCASLNAQNTISAIDLSTGPAIFIYQGDLTPKRIGSYRNLKPGFIVNAACIVSASLSLRLSVTTGSLRGDETKYNKPVFRKFRAFKFQTPVLEFSPQAVWNPLSNNLTESNFFPYIFGGPAINLFRIKRDYSGYDPSYFGIGSDIPQLITADEQQRPPRVRTTLLLGGGIQYNISNSIAVSAETAYRFLSTDYPDGFSKAVNPKNNDHYQTFSVGLIFRLVDESEGKNQMGCPVVR